MGSEMCIRDRNKVEQAAAGVPGGEPVSDDPPTGLAKPAPRGRGGTKYGDASQLTGGTSVEEVLSSSEDEAEREKAASDLTAAWERYRRSKFDEQDPLKDYLFERYGRKGYYKRFGRKRKQADIDASVAMGRHKGEFGGTYAKRGVLMRTLARALASAEMNHLVAEMLSEQAVAKEGSIRAGSGRPLIPIDVLGMIDALKEPDPIRYEIKKSRIRAGQHLAYRRQQDRGAHKYSEAQCTSRHHSRVRAAEKVAYDMGILKEIPKDQRPPQPPPRQGPKVMTEYARKHKDDRRLMSGERQDFAIRTSFQAAAAAAGLAAWPRAAGDEIACHRDYLANTSFQGSFDNWVETMSPDLAGPYMSTVIGDLEKLEAAPFCTLAREGEAPTGLTELRDAICRQFLTMKDALGPVRAMDSSRAKDSWWQLVRRYYPGDAAYVSRAASRRTSQERRALTDRAKAVTWAILEALLPSPRGATGGDGADGGGPGGGGGPGPSGTCSEASASAQGDGSWRKRRKGRRRKRGRA